MASQFVRWIHETYFGQLGLADLEGGRKYRQFIESPDAKHHMVSGAFRVQAFHIIKYGYPMRRAGYDVAVFSVKAGGDKDPPAFYAYAYWPLAEGAQGVSKDTAGDDAPGAPEYVCYSPTFESRDGEYRHHFLWYPQFAEAMEKAAFLGEAVEEKLLAAIRDGKIEIDVRPYGEDTERVAAYCADSRIAIQLLTACVLNGPMRKIGTYHQSHVLESYKKVVDKVFKLAGGVVPKITDEQMADWARLETGQPHANFTQCGQKLTPLTLREATHLGDINYAAWREVYVNNLATELVINGVSPCFPIFGNWSYVTGADRRLFEGRPMRERYDRGNQAVGALESLREARARIKERASSDYRAGQLDAHIYESIVYALDFLVMSRFAMCSTSEFVGYTLRSVPTIIRRRRLVNPAYLRLFSCPIMTARYLFDLCYSTHALHTRVGAIHADLHMNNVTINPFAPRWDLFVGREPQERPTRNPVIAFVAGPRGEADTYVFPHDGFFATVIDFSRAILGPTARERLVAEKGEAYAVAFYRNQVGRALRVIHHYVPSFATKHQEKLKGLLLSDPEIMFRVMTAVDFLSVGRDFVALFRHVAETEGAAKGARNPIKLGGGARLAERLERAALEHLVARLSDLVTGRARRDPAEYPHIGTVLLPVVFRDYRFSVWAQGRGALKDTPAESTLVDVYSTESKTHYSSTDPANFPPWARLDVVEKNLDGKVKMIDVTADRGERPFLRAHDPDSLLDVLIERARHDVERHDHPADATSSWIAE